MKWGLLVTRTPLAKRSPVGSLVAGAQDSLPAVGWSSLLQGGPRRHQLPGPKTEMPSKSRSADGWSKLGSE